MSYRVGIDIGGTFTDFALLKGDEVVLHKNLSTPEDRSLGVMQGLETLAGKEGLSLADFMGKCDAIVHGTTVADNTLIEIDRDPEAVKEDVLDEYVSLGAARTKYGVVLTGTLENYDLAVDVAATEALRREMTMEPAA